MRLNRQPLPKDVRDRLAREWDAAAARGAEKVAAEREAQREKETKRLELLRRQAAELQAEEEKGS